MGSRFPLLCIAALLSACASTGATFRSGVGDSYPERPPYYAGAPTMVAADTVDTAGSVGTAPRLGHLPVAFQRGASQPAIFDPRDGSGSPAARLAEEMTALLDSLGVSMRLVEGRRVSAVAHQATGTPPDVYFGCVTDGLLPSGDCVERDEGALGRNRHALRLAVGRPSREWSAWLQEVSRENNVASTLVVTLEVGQHLLTQSGWRGGKEVHLGTGHVVKLPWLTSLETPVSVLQLTGAVVQPDGTVRRIGAEGILAVRSNLLVSAIGAQALLGDDDVERARTLRRDDLPGNPLAWQVALRHLVAGLTGRADLAPK